MGNVGNLCNGNKPSTNKEFRSHTDIKGAYTKQYTAQSSHGKRERACTVTESEIVTAKIRVQSDRIETRLKKLEKQDAEIDAKIKELIQAKKKEEAYTNLKKKAEIRKRIKDAKVKMDFLDKQVLSLENAENDLAFSKVVADSNKLIEKLSSEIDHDEILLAKQLQDETKARKEEIMALLEDEDDDEIKNQLDEIEMNLNSQQNSNLDKKKHSGLEDFSNIKTIKKVDVQSELLLQ